MKAIEIQALTNGAHRNYTGNFTRIPEGYAIIPDDMAVPDTFPFVDIEVTEETRYREERKLQKVKKTRLVPVVDENGEYVVDEEGNVVKEEEEYEVEEIVTVSVPYTVMVVTSMTAGIVPEPAPAPEPEPTTDEILDTLLGVNEDE